MTMAMVAMVHHNIAVHGHWGTAGGRKGLKNGAQMCRGGYYRAAWGARCSDCDMGSVSQEGGCRCGVS